MGDKAKEIQWGEGGGGEEEARSFINIEHVTEKSDRSSLQGVRTQRDK